MFKSRRKLALRTETIRKLGTNQLRGVAGGQTAFQCSTICSDASCPDTEFVNGCNGQTVTCPASIECPSELCTVHPC